MADIVGIIAHILYTQYTHLYTIYVYCCEQKSSCFTSCVDDWKYVLSEDIVRWSFYDDCTWDVYCFWVM